MTPVFLPAHASNYTVGRGRPIAKFTVHHMAGTPSTLASLWGDPTRNASSHFGVFPSKVEQYVKLTDTAWTNTNWASNQESITCETWGDWRNGFVSRESLANLKEVMKHCRNLYPHLVLEFHQDVSSSPTACPAGLRAYAQNVWDEVTREINQQTTTANITYATIVPKKVKLNKIANLWDFNFSKWSDAKAVKDFPAGNIIDVVAVATNVLGARYYMTAYSYNNGNIKATNGFNVVDCDDYSEPIVEPPTPPQTPVVPVEPPKPPIIAPDPVFDIEARLTTLEKLVKTITDFLDKIFKWRS